MTYYVLTPPDEGNLAKTTNDAGLASVLLRQKDNTDTTSDEKQKDDDDIDNNNRQRTFCCVAINDAGDSDALPTGGSSHKEATRE